MDVSGGSLTLVTTPTKNAMLGRRSTSIITKEGVRMPRPDQVMIIRVIGDQINKSVKVF